MNKEITLSLSMHDQAWAVLEERYDLLTDLSDRLLSLSAETSDDVSIRYADLMATLSIVNIAIGNIDLMRGLRAEGYNPTTEMMPNSTLHDRIPTEAINQTTKETVLEWYDKQPDNKKKELFENMLDRMSFEVAMSVINDVKQDHS